MDNKRINMRTESSMKQIYKVLDRTPCPDDLTHWKFRIDDFGEFDYTREIKKCLKKKLGNFLIRARKT